MIESIKDSPALEEVDSKSDSKQGVFTHINIKPITEDVAGERPSLAKCKSTPGDSATPGTLDNPITGSSQSGGPGANRISVGKQICAKKGPLQIQVPGRDLLDQVHTKEKRRKSIQETYLNNQKTNKGVPPKLNNNSSLVNP